MFMAAVIAGAISVACMAQVEEEEQDGPISFSYATYNYCKLSGQDRADEIVKETEAPIYNELLEEGVIDSWGWLSHHTGGQWRRVLYFGNETLPGLLDALDAIQEKFGALDLDDDDSRADLCAAHDDYIWAVEATSGGPGDSRPEAGLSAYYICDVAAEERADELFESTFAPELDKAVAGGKIASWGWLSHVIGGKYRRLLTTTGGDHKALLAARGDILEALYGGDEPNANAVEFTSICGAHSDYMWDTQVASP